MGYLHMMVIFMDHDGCYRTISHAFFSVKLEAKSLTWVCNGVGIIAK